METLVFAEGLNSTGGLVKVFIFFVLYTRLPDIFQRYYNELVIKFYRLYISVYFIYLFL